MPPFDEQEARAIVGRTRGARLLAGVRGRPPGAVDALMSVIMNLRRLAVDVGDAVCELDVNPLLVLPAGQGGVAVDALVVGA